MASVEATKRDTLTDTWWATTAKLAPTTRRGYWQLLENRVRPYFGTRVQGSIDWAEVERFIAQIPKDMRRSGCTDTSSRALRKR